MPSARSSSSQKVAKRTATAREEKSPWPVVTLPDGLRFPLVVTISLLLSSVLYTIAAPTFAGDLGSVSRRLNEWWEVVGLIAWRSVELGIGWWSDYDGVDLASLTLLSHLPPLFLLTSFYAIRPTTVVASLAIDLITTYLPFRLLRPLLPAHRPASTKAVVPNRSVINDLPVRLVTTTLGAAIYGTLLYGSYRSWLPIHLITSFDGLKDISAAHAPALPRLIATFLPVGYAAHEFLFAPYAAAQAEADGERPDPFDPVTASLGETLRYNFWGYSRPTKFLLTRMITLIVVTGVNTWLHTFVTIDGAEIRGAIGWAAVWVVAAALSSVAFGWVGRASDVVDLAGPHRHPPRSSLMADSTDGG